MIVSDARAFQSTFKMQIFVSQFPKETWTQRKQHQKKTFVPKASEPCQNIDISNVAYCFSQHDHTVTSVPYASSCARLCSPPAPTRSFLARQIFTNPYPGSQFFSRVRSHPISARKQNVAKLLPEAFCEIPPYQ